MARRIAPNPVTIKGGSKRRKKRATPKCDSNRPPCGLRCLPPGQECRIRENKRSKTGQVSSSLTKAIQRTKSNRAKKTTKDKPLQLDKPATIALQNLQTTAQKAGVKRTRELGDEKALRGGAVEAGRSEGISRRRSGATVTALDILRREIDQLIRRIIKGKEN